MLAGEPGIGKTRTVARLFGDVDGMLQGESAVVSILDNPLHISAAHRLGDHEWLSLVLAQVEQGDDVGVGARCPMARASRVIRVRETSSRPSVLMRAKTTSRSNRVSWDR